MFRMTVVEDHALVGRQHGACNVHGAFCFLFSRDAGSAKAVHHVPEQVVAWLLAQAEAKRVPSLRCEGVVPEGFVQRCRRRDAISPRYTLLRSYLHGVLHVEALVASL